MCVIHVLMLTYQVAERGTFVPYLVLVRRFLECLASCEIEALTHPVLPISEMDCGNESKF